MKPYSLDLRQRAVDLYQKHSSFRVVGKMLQISHACVRDLVRLWQRTGTLEPQLQNCGRPPTITEREKQLLAQWLEEENGLTLKELRQRLAERGVKVSHTAIGNALKAMRITRKKRRPSPRKGTVRTSARSAGAGTRKR